jgi:hypothetical protein
MNIRPHIASDPAAFLRPSARVARVAEILDCDERDVRRMIEEGDLEAHGKGKRGVRVFLDSVSDYQASRILAVKGKRKSGKTEAKRVHASGAAHLSAVVELRKSGLLP